MCLKPLAEHQFYRPTTPGLGQQPVARIKRIRGNAGAGPGLRRQRGFAPAGAKLSLAEQPQQENSSRFGVVHLR
jgi:hypothetical protein